MTYTSILFKIVYSLHITATNVRDTQFMKIILLGAPGSGRKTQAYLIAQKYHIADISVGHLLRSAVKNKSTAGQKAYKMMHAGKLIPDDIILEVIKERLLQKDAAKGFVLNGYPNNISQAEELDKLLKKIDRVVEHTFFLDVNNDTVIRRLTGRRNCLKCGKKTNVSYNPPLQEDTCNDCGGILMRRADDNPQSILELLKIYNAQTRPLSEYYRQLGKNISLDGNIGIDNVFKKIQSELKQSKQISDNKKTKKNKPKKNPKRKNSKQKLLTEKNSKNKKQNKKTVKKRPNKSVKKKAKK